MQRVKQLSALRVQIICKTALFQSCKKIKEMQKPAGKHWRVFVVTEQLVYGESKSLQAAWQMMQTSSLYRDYAQIKIYVDNPAKNSRQRSNQDALRKAGPALGWLIPASEREMLLL